MKKLICMIIMCSFLTGCGIPSEADSITETKETYLPEISSDIPEEAVLKIISREYLRSEYTGDSLLKINIEYQNSHGDVVLSGSCDTETEVFSPSENHIYQYDANGNMIQESMINQNNAKNIFYEYDEYQNLIRETTHFRNSGGKQVISRTYDQYGNLMTNHLMNYNSEGAVILDDDNQKVNCEYDENGNLLKYGLDIGNNVIFYAETNTYDEQNQLLCYEHLNTLYDGEDNRDYCSVHHYEYDENGNQILDELTVYPEPNVISDVDSETEIFQYDEQNRLIHREMHYGYGSVIYTDYEYENL